MVGVRSRSWSHLWVSLSFEALLHIIHLLTQSIFFDPLAMSSDLHLHVYSHSCSACFTCFVPPLKASGDRKHECAARALHSAKTHLNQQSLPSNFQRSFMGRATFTTAKKTRPLLVDGLGCFRTSGASYSATIHTTPREEVRNETLHSA